MAIPYCTGDGTSGSPYIPTGTNEERCQGFLNAIAETKAYVKLTSMIDFSTHPVYKTGFISYIPFNCYSLTADLDANGLPQYGVSGLVFKTTDAATHYGNISMFGFPNHNNWGDLPDPSQGTYYNDGVINISGIKFVNFLISNYGFSGSWSSSDYFLRLFAVGNNGYAMTQNFSNCAFSGIVKLRTNCFSISDAEYKDIYYNDCSVYLTFQQPEGSYLKTYINSNSSTYGSDSPFGNMTRCCVVVTGVKAYRYLSMNNCNDCTFLFNNLVYVDNDSSGAITPAKLVGICCIENGKPPISVSGNVIIAKISRTVVLAEQISIVCKSASSVVAITDSDGNPLDSSLWYKQYDSTITDFASGNVGAYTPDDLKDVNKLVECGFIP